MPYRKTEQYQVLSICRDIPLHYDSVDQMYGKYELSHLTLRTKLQYLFGKVKPDASLS